MTDVIIHDASRRVVAATSGRGDMHTFEHPAEQ